MAGLIENRVRRLEQQDSASVRHVVHWMRGESFEEALSRSTRPEGANDRLLIERVAVTGGHGKPVVPIIPDDHPEVLSALAWAERGR